MTSTLRSHRSPGRCSRPGVCGNWAADGIASEKTSHACDPAPRAAAHPTALGRVARARAAAWGFTPSPRGVGAPKFYLPSLPRRPARGSRPGRPRGTPEPWVFAHGLRPAYSRRSRVPGISAPEPRGRGPSATCPRCETARDSRPGGSRPIMSRGLGGLSSRADAPPGRPQAPMWDSGLVKIFTSAVAKGTGPARRPCARPRLAWEVPTTF